MSAIQGEPSHSLHCYVALNEERSSSPLRCINVIMRLHKVATV